MMKLSIITVCLNNIDGLSRTGESIVRQQRGDVEWIVIDGGSTDGTLEYLRNNDCVDRYVSEPDTGVYNAMNKGIIASKGEYLLFLNSGDHFYDETVISSVLPMLTGDIFIGQCFRVDPLNKNNDKYTKFDEKFLKKQVLYSRTLPHQSTFVKKELFKLYGLYDETYKIAADHDFFLRVICNNVHVDISTLCVSAYYLDGISSDPDNKLICENEIARIQKSHFSIAFRTYMIMYLFLKKIKNMMRN